ncbi:helix-turn-helix domain-containing protein [uncultured Clostridium sp.]|uniref:helix-turn-helix domain-containing protein n=1 Tax=uncultured Clostridium sp. TaxID=59620 RepID=UPI0025E5DAD1|nr:helix-turn-helix transcriptional regulator [uncultured Clostridium sp.]
MSRNKKMQEIMERVKKRRNELNLSFEDLSKRTGFGKSTLQRYETGLINSMPINRFELLAEGLEIEPYKLMGWDEEYLLSQDQKDEAYADIVDLHNIFLKLNECGRKRVLGYIFDIASIDKYLLSNEQNSDNTIDTENIKKHICYDSNSNSLSNAEHDNNNKLTSMFTTVAAHNDDIDNKDETALDEMFMKAIIKDKNK